MRPIRMFALLTLLMACTSQAIGHAHLLSSLPAANSRLAGAPAQLVLRFNETVQAVAVSLRGEAHPAPVVLPPARPDAAAVSLKLPALEPDTYEVRWRALSGGDGHLVRGSFVFTVSASAAP